jgi:hypothetical protein
VQHGHELKRRICSPMKSNPQRLSPDLPETPSLETPQRILQGFDAMGSVEQPAMLNRHRTTLDSTSGFSKEGNEVWHAWILTF